MQMLVPGLAASAPQPLPFDTSLAVRAYLLQRAGGNLVIYGAGTPSEDVAEMRDRGGVWRQYLNHRHEAMFGCSRIGAPLVVHAAEREAVRASCSVAETFSERHAVGDDFEVIPIPGHTPGATAYLWDSGEHRYLFTGDSVYLRDGEWVAALLAGSSDRDAYLESLALLRDVDFDVLVPWAATRGEPAYSVVSNAEARRRLDAIIARLGAGQDS